MVKWENEKGYALLIVLFLIVFIMTVFAIFMRGSINNAMQEHRVDESHLTVMTAEAGVDYIKQLLINEYFEKKVELNEFAENKISSAVQDNKQVNYDEIHNEVKGKLKGYLENRIRQEKLSANHGKFIDPYSYKLIESTFSNGSNPLEITFSGTIEGRGPSKGSKELTKKITIKQSFLIPDYRGSANPGGGMSVVPPNMHKLYPDNVSVSNCSGDRLSDAKCKASQNADYKSIANSTVYFPEGFNKNNGNFQVSQSKLYGKGTFKVENYNKLVGTTVNIDGSFQAKNMNGIEKSTMNINGSLNMTSNTKMDESTMIVRGATRFNGHLTVGNNSLVCIGGSFQVDKKLTIVQGSKVVYWGSMVANGGKHVTGELIQVSTESELWEKCKLGNSDPLVWTKPVLEDVTYE